ncbi:Dihydropteroate synthase [Thiothrix caldifontis]|jgi:dihydropteroate synthase|uniref:Dihydropteroate synthase n=1 Tax=Thiothrix caldifontis TaxID=525918 RepID=A0A1H4EVW7_9GAMM|nr:dihydropteroate synthase [Thiothrix caldifontis]SEA89184.1 Dihydropteroate synthase [Thiothrix caldifontis]
MTWKIKQSSVQVMGILNVTPDSFSDGGLFHGIDTALRHVEQMLQEGVDIIDVGGESTRPGAASVPIQVELDRVIPIIEAIRSRFAVPLSVDTSKPEVMLAAVAAGVSLINDVCALQQSGALEACAKLTVPVCLMHMQGQPRTMQQAPYYQDVIGDVRQFFQERIAVCELAGIDRKRLIVDPGFGFGKTLMHNVSLLRDLGEFSALGLPILVGLSRKTMIGNLLNNRPVHERVYGSVAAAVIAAMHGANIVRVHDVGATVDAIKLVNAVLEKN